VTANSPAEASQERAVMLEDVIYEEMTVSEISRDKSGCHIQEISKKVIAEISLKIMVNESELVSILCLNQLQEELALGFLYNEGVINAYTDVDHISFNEKMLAVDVKLKDEIVIDRQESLRSITSGCGKCYTYINPLKQSQYKTVQSEETFSIEAILSLMKDFLNKSELFKNIGGVHSVLLYTPEYERLTEDIGRHNCFDKMTGIMLKEDRLDLFGRGIVFVSGRISSEIMAKIIRIGVPALTTRGMKEKEVKKIAEWMDAALRSKGDAKILKSLRRDVTALCKKFPLYR